MTSLIPTVLALSEFFSKNFPDSISWYPYWYLGNPYHYLIGPVVPILLGVVRGIGVSLEGAYLWLIFASFLLGGLGIFLLLRDWGVQMRSAILSGMLYIILPAGFFLLNYQNGLNHIAFGLLSFVLLLFKKFLVKENKLLIVFLTLTITIMLLTNVSILLPLVIGFIALFVSVERKDVAYEKIGKIILIILLSLSLSTLWYTPKFWWVIATNPSLGGVPLGKLAWSILQFLLQFLPLVLAIAVVKFRKYKFQGYLLFGFLFFVSFLFLSLVRFVSDPDFVMDWIGFGLELQFGGAIILGNIKYQISNIKYIYQKFKIISIIVGFILLLIVDFMVISTVFKNDTKNDYQSSIISMLRKNVKENERVFLSGSSVFFINSKLNIQQVRGGVDQGSIHPFWAMGAYQIREGTSASFAYDWLRALGISYVLVHDKGSVEPFKDFKYTLKFAPYQNGTGQADFEMISGEGGDRLYRVNNVSIGRVADASILDVRKPRNGADEQARPLAVNYQKPNEIAISGDIKQGEVVSLAISYDSLWRMAYGKGTIMPDSLGNMAIIPKKSGLQRFELAYKRSLLDMAIPLGLSIIIAIILIKYQKIAPYVRERIPRLSVGLRDEEE